MICVIARQLFENPAGLQYFILNSYLEGYIQIIYILWIQDTNFHKHWLLIHSQSRYLAPSFLSLIYLMDIDFRSLR